MTEKSCVTGKYWEYLYFIAEKNNQGYSLRTSTLVSMTNETPRKFTFLCEFELSDDTIPTVRMPTPFEN